MQEVVKESQDNTEILRREAQKVFIAIQKQYWWNVSTTTRHQQLL